MNRKELEAILEGGCTDLSGADLSGVDLRGLDLPGVDLTEADLQGVQAHGGDLRGANLSSANLDYADLRFTDSREVDLTDSDLAYGILREADLSKASLWGADLGGADLRDTELAGADLTEADLEGTIGNMQHVKTILCDTYAVTYTAVVMQIGCQRHPIEDWWTFDDQRILKMDGKRALEWWRRWKPILRQIIEVSPATPTEPGQHQHPPLRLTRVVPPPFST